PRTTPSDRLRAPLPVRIRGRRGAAERPVPDHREPALVHQHEELHRDYETVVDGVYQYTGPDAARVHVDSRQHERQCTEWDDSNRPLPHAMSHHEQETAD